MTWRHLGAMARRFNKRKTQPDDAAAAFKDYWSANYLQSAIPEAQAWAEFQQGWDSES